MRAGARDEIAALHAGVPVETVKVWLQGETKATRDWAATVQKARADLQLLALGFVRRDMSENATTALTVAQMVSADIELDRLRRLTT